MPDSTQPSIGYLVGGSLKDNFRVRLTVDPLTVQEGAFVVIESGHYRFYGLVTDLELGATDPRYPDDQPTIRPAPPLAKALHRHTLYTTQAKQPNIMFEQEPEPGPKEY